MKYIQGQSRTQTSLFPVSLDDAIDPENEVHTGSEFDIKVMVAIPEISRSSQAPDPGYNVEHFTYNQEDNTYTCPQGHVLTTNVTWHTADSGSRFQQFKTRACKGCPVQERCTKSKKNGKIVQRRRFAENIEANRKRIEADPAAYKKRQAIVEHPYGTIKRQWGFSYVLTKKYHERASADIGFMMLAYNLRRLINIIGKEGLKEYLAGINSLYSLFLTIGKRIGTHLRGQKFRRRLCEDIFCQSLNRLYLSHNL